MGEPIWDDAALCVQTLAFMRMLLCANEVHALYSGQKKKVNGSVGNSYRPVARGYLF